MKKALQSNIGKATIFATAYLAAYMVVTEGLRKLAEWLDEWGEE